MAVAVELAPQAALLHGEFEAASPAWCPAHLQQQKHLGEGEIRLHRLGPAGDVQIHLGPMPGRGMAAQDLVARMLGVQAWDRCPAVQMDTRIRPARLGQLRQHRCRGICWVLIVQLNQ